MPRLVDKGNVLVGCWAGTFELTPGVIDHHAEIVFTQGQCHSFARALHELTGWQLAVGCYSGERWTHPGGPVIVTRPIPKHDGDHVVCITPDGQIADVYGLTDRESFMRRWGFAELVEVAESTVKRLGWYRQNIRAARPFAAAVLTRIAEAA